jgi:hypothetical protein
VPSGRIFREQDHENLFRIIRVSQAGEGDLDVPLFVSEDDQQVVDALRARKIEPLASEILSSRAAD